MYSDEYSRDTAREKKNSTAIRGGGRGSKSGGIVIWKGWRGLMFAGALSSRNDTVLNLLISHWCTYNKARVVQYLERSVVRQNHQADRSKTNPNMIHRMYFYRHELLFCRDGRLLQRGLTLGDRYLLLGCRICCLLVLELAP